MRNKSVRIPLVPIIILLVIIAITFFIGKKNSNTEDFEDENIRNKTIFEVNNIVARSGDEITINIKMLNNSNFVAANFELLYDNSKMEYVKYEKGEILEKGAMAIANNDEENNKMLIAYVGNPQNEIDLVDKGDLISITYKLKKTIQNNEIVPEFKCTTLKDKDGNDIPVIINQGKIIVK